jgi:hypothetical protein
LPHQRRTSDTQDTRSYFARRWDDLAMVIPLQQQPIGATEVFDLLWTAVVLLVTVLGAYAARQSWLQFQAGDTRLRWMVTAGIGTSLAILGTLSLLRTLAAALGVV